VGWRAYPPPRGQLTRCFSAVAELLVMILRETSSVTELNWTEPFSASPETSQIKLLLGSSADFCQLQ